MKKAILLIGLVLLIPLASAVTFEDVTPFTITKNVIIEVGNKNIGDNNIVDLYCDDFLTNTCRVYRTNVKHTTLKGD